MDRFAPDSWHSWGPFFSDKAAVCERELDTDGLAGLRLSGAASTPKVPIIVDPDPDQGYRKNLTETALLAWLVPLLSILYLWLLRKWTRRNGMHRAVCLLLLNGFIYSRVGGYSRPTAALALLAMAAAAAYFVFGKAIARRYGAEDQG